MDEAAVCTEDQSVEAQAAFVVGYVPEKRLPGVPLGEAGEAGGLI